MWPLRQNVQYNKHYFFKDIFRVVFVAHLVLLAIFFTCDSIQLHQDKFVINSQPLQSTVVFLPLHKNLVQHKKGNPEEAAKNRAVMNYDEYEKKVSAQPHHKNIAPVEQQDLKKVVEKKETPLTKQPEKTSLTVLQDEKKSLAAKKAAAEKAEKAARAKAAAEKAKKDAQVKAAADKKKAAEKIKSEKEKREKALADKKKAEEKKIADKKLQDKLAADKKKLEAAAHKKVESVVEPVVEEVVQQTIVQEVVEENSSIVQAHDDTAFSLDNSDENIDLENVTFVGRNDLDSIQIKELIKAEISKYYRPPVGTNKDLVCELSVLVGKDGKAVRVTIKNSSGSIANDMCARAALLKVDFPKDVIGKEIIVDLGQ